MHNIRFGLAKPVASFEIEEKTFVSMGLPLKTCLRTCIRPERNCAGDIKPRRECRVDHRQDIRGPRTVHLIAALRHQYLVSRRLALDPIHD